MEEHSLLQGRERIEILNPIEASLMATPYQ
jgi:hypothetical protein